MLILALLLLSLLPQDSSAAAEPTVQNTSGGPLRPAQACFDVQHYDLRLEIDPDERRIAAQLRMTALALEPARSIELDLDDRLETVLVRSSNGVKSATHAAGRITIEFEQALQVGQEFDVTVGYEGQPRVAPRPPWDGGFTWAETAAGEPWIATSCQGEGADLWWPCKDHPSDKPETMDIRVTIPEGLFCASNGVLVSDHTADGERTQHWHVASPINNYSVALNIAPYEALTTEFESVGGETVPVTFWVLPEHVEQGRAILPEFLEHLAFMEEYCGPYPFRTEKYGVVETPHLGMEHQTIIAYGNGFRRGRDGFDWLHHHELSHEWWANLVTARDWKDLWLHEGFGTYMQSLYIERLHGTEAYQKHMRSKQRRLRNRRPIAPRESHDSKQIYFGLQGGADNDPYDKGACVLHSLRWVLGDEVFFETLRRMAYPTAELERVTDGSQVRFADTDDLRILAETYSKRELDWFFEVYLRRAELPRLLARREGSELVLAWETAFPTAFPMPVPVRVGDELVRVEMPLVGEQRLELGDAEFELDPEGWLLRQPAPR